MDNSHSERFASHIIPKNYFLPDQKINFMRKQETIAITAIVIVFSASFSPCIVNASTVVSSNPAPLQPIVYGLSVKQMIFPNEPTAVNATLTSDYIETIPIIIVANVLNYQQAIIEVSTATVTLAYGQTASGYPIIQGLPNGTYTVLITATLLHSSHCQLQKL